MKNGPSRLTPAVRTKVQRPIRPSRPKLSALLVLSSLVLFDMKVALSYEQKPNGWVFKLDLSWRHNDRGEAAPRRKLQIPRSNMSG